MSRKQPIFGLILLTLIFIIIGNTYVGLIELGIFLLFGIAYGIVLERSRFCFASSLRDLFITKNTRLARGVAIGILVATIGFSILMMSGIRNPKVLPVGLHTLIGGILFGFGMVLAGGCASGTLFRIGEGYVTLWFALMGTLTGMILLAATWPLLWNNYIQYQPKIWLVDYLGWSGAIALTISLILIYYAIATLWERR
ncbi:MAG: YeeE/YedE thiosulfate transporter family protein [Candidatus Asgardarchaeia archaeon]